jgi:Cdc6-like AAA superfamily ATPase
MKDKVTRNRPGSIYETDFWKIHWGLDEAKGDDKLNTYFSEIPEYEGIKNGEYRYIIGRKGTGKTAIIEQLTNEIEGSYDKFYKYLSLKNFPIQSLRGLKDKSQGDKKPCGVG